MAFLDASELQGLPVVPQGTATLLLLAAPHARADRMMGVEGEAIEVSRLREAGRVALFTPRACEVPGAAFVGLGTNGACGSSGWVCLQG